MSQILGSKAILLVVSIAVGVLVVFLLKYWSDNYLCGRWIVRGALIISVSSVVFIKALAWHVLAAAAVLVAYSAWWSYAALRRIPILAELRGLRRSRCNEIERDFNNHEHSANDVIRRGTPTLPGFSGRTYSDLYYYSRDIRWELTHRDAPCISLVMVVVLGIAMLAVLLIAAVNVVCVGEYGEFANAVIGKIDGGFMLILRLCFGWLRR